MSKIHDDDNDVIDCRRWQQNKVYRPNDKQKEHDRTDEQKEKCFAIYYTLHSNGRRTISFHFFVFFFHHHKAHRTLQVNKIFLCDCHWTRQRQSVWQNWASKVYKLFLEFRFGTIVAFCQLSTDLISFFSIVSSTLIATIGECFYCEIMRWLSGGECVCVSGRMEIIGQRFVHNDFNSKYWFRRFVSIYEYLPIACGSRDRNS